VSERQTALMLMLIAACAFALLWVFIDTNPF